MMRNFIYRNHTLKVFGEKYFYKIGISGFGKKLVQLESTNYGQLAKVEAVSSYVPQTELKKGSLYSSMKIESLNPLDREVDSELGSILSKFREAAREVKFTEFANKYSDFQCYKKLSDFLGDYSEDSLLVGPSHGDLHDENLMTDSAGSTKFIDTDMFSPLRDCYFDLINIFVSRAILNKLVTWDQAILDAWNLESELAKIDSSWDNLDSRKKYFHFALYILERFENEYFYNEKLVFPKSLSDWLAAARPQ